MVSVWFHQHEEPYRTSGVYTGDEAYITADKVSLVLYGTDAPQEVEVAERDGGVWVLYEDNMAYDAVSVKAVR